METETIQVLDQGYVRLDGVFADDLAVVNAARVSYLQRHDKMSDADKGLIGYLMKNKHGTPFEHNFFCFEVKAPIKVFREWHRHRVGISINEQSARYMEVHREFYVPTYVRKQIGAPGHYTYEAVEVGSDLWCEARQIIGDQGNAAFDAYDKLLGLGIAKEQARDVLNVSTYSTMIWSCNARSLMAFLELRNSDAAMWEIRQYAIHLENIFVEAMPITAAAFIANGRRNP